MIIPGRALVPKIVDSVLSAKLQTQPCGVDLSLKRVFKFMSAGTVDFDNCLREKAAYSELSFGFCNNECREDEGKPSGVDMSESILNKTSSSVDQQFRGPGDRSSNVSDNPANSILLAAGSYSVEFNETVNVPLDMMGQVFTRSSLYRSGAFMVTGVVDSGYAGPLGGMLVVSNLHGIRLVEGAKLAQIVFHQMTEQVDGYKGVYQGQAFTK